MTVEGLYVFRFFDVVKPWPIRWLEVDGAFERISAEQVRKAAAPLVQRSGQELKLVFPQPEPEASPENFVDLDFEHFLLQPLDGPALTDNTRQAVQYCLSHPRWKLSLQTHKILGID